MHWKLPLWRGRSGRQQMLDTYIDRSRQATFGFESVPAEEKANRVCEHFNSVAEHYDFMNTLLSFGVHHLWKRCAVKVLDLRPGMRVLDVCGGTGDLAILAQRRVGPQGQVGIYDINHAMMSVGRRTTRHAAIRRKLGYIQGNAEQIAFGDGSFDAVMVGFGIRNVTHMVRAFEEMYRVLKPGGRLMCLEFSKPTAPVFRWLYDLYSFSVMPVLGGLLAGSQQAYRHLPETIRLFPLPDELVEVFIDIGFEVVNYRRLTNGIAVVHSATKPA